MSKLQNKIDFIVLVSVKMANANGDPLNGNRPRTDYDGYGEMSDVCIKRKIRNRMQDMGQDILVRSNDRADDGLGSVKARVENGIGKKGKEETDKAYADKACAKWLDVRAFGQVLAFEGKDEKGVSVGIRGPVSLHQAVSVSPVEVESMQITKSVNNEDGNKKGSDTMGMKHFVRFGLYKIKGSINVQLAEKTCFSEEDAEILKKCLQTLFVNDASAARPDGSMEVVKVYWWKHNCKDGQYSAAKVHGQVSVVLKDGVTTPTCVEDYDITLQSLPDLALEVIDGV